ncbi:MAG: sigma-70 family RNA polymerase sigma factor [Actinomycetota bacterium]
MSSDEAFLRATMGSMDLVYNVARRMVRTPEDVEDLVQETYLAAFRAWKDHRRPDRIEPWLVTICLNLGRSRFRRLAARPHEVELSDVVEDTRPATNDTERDALAAVARSDLYRAMWGLPEEQRVAITLVDLSGFSTADAAETMGTPRGTVLSRLHRGRKALALLLPERAREVNDR